MLQKAQNLLEQLRDRLPLKSRMGELNFQSAGELTLGVEIELQVIDPVTLNLVSRAEELLKAGQHLKKLKPEFYLSTLEINTDKCTDVHAVAQDLAQTLAEVNALGDRLGVSFATTGCHPFARYADAVITPSARYHELIDRNQWLTRRMTVYGLHVHIGMRDGDSCMRLNNFFLHFLPHLLALSASSPFWQGDDTGLASCRPTTYEALPTAGQPYPANSWREFEQLYETLKKCHAINSLKDLWWDLRPSPQFGTLEIRVCDGLATLQEAVAVTALIHLLAHWFHDHGSWIDQFPPPQRWVARENKWRVMRHGLDANLVVGPEGDTKLVRQDITEWLEKLAPYAVNLGYQSYVDHLYEIMEKGNSSQRQRKIFESDGTLQEVVRHNVAEFRAGKPSWQP